MLRAARPRLTIAAREVPGPRRRGERRRCPSGPRRLHRGQASPIIGSLPGMGPLLTAELLVHTAGMTEYDSPAKLAAHAGLAPVSRDSGTVSGNHRPPRRFHRRLRHILWMAAFTAARECPTLYPTDTGDPRRSLTRPIPADVTPVPPAVPPRPPRSSGVTWRLLRRRSICA
ncbi:transposase [Micromonospora sp. NBC_00617]|uniref:transposase n=1 Tax=Micromonospora sp. NBC_00617 TaxID=2903587 RepID=UPI0030E5F770